MSVAVNVNPERISWVIELENVPVVALTGYCSYVESYVVVVVTPAASVDWTRLPY